MAATSDTAKASRQRVPAGERRDALIDAAIHEFAQTGLHGTPVDRIARSVGVAQPYVFSLFGSKRELFLAAVDRCFSHVQELMTLTAEQFDPSEATEGYDVLLAMGNAYVQMLAHDRDTLMLQLQAYAACDDETIRDRVRSNYAQLVRLVEKLAPPEVDRERIDNFFRYGMWLNVTAAMGVEDLSVGCEWIAAEPAQDGAAG